MVAWNIYTSTMCLLYQLKYSKLTALHSDAPYFKPRLRHYITYLLFTANPGTCAWAYVSHCYRTRTVRTVHYVQCRDCYIDKDLNDHIVGDHTRPQYSAQYSASNQLGHISAGFSYMYTQYCREQYKICSEILQSCLGLTY